MKLDFALSLSVQSIALLQREGNGWRVLDEISPQADDLKKAMNRLRMAGLKSLATQAEQTREGAIPAEAALPCLVLLPNDQIRYLVLANAAMDHKTVGTALEGATPYAVADLAFDIASDGEKTFVAAVAKETLEEASHFAKAHGFDVRAYGALPPAGHFVGQPIFLVASADAEQAAAMAPREKPEDPKGKQQPAVDLGSLANSLLAPHLPNGRGGGGSFLPAARWMRRVWRSRRLVRVGIVLLAIAVALLAAMLTWGALVKNDEDPISFYLRQNPVVPAALVAPDTDGLRATRAASLVVGSGQVAPLPQSPAIKAPRSSLAARAPKAMAHRAVPALPAVPSLLVAPRASLEPLSRSPPGAGSVVPGRWLESRKAASPRAAVVGSVAPGRWLESPAIRAPRPPFAAGAQAMARRAAPALPAVPSPLVAPQGALFGKGHWASLEPLSSLPPVVGSAEPGRWLAASLAPLRERPAIDPAEAGPAAPDRQIAAEEPVDVETAAPDRQIAARNPAEVEPPASDRQRVSEAPTEAEPPASDRQRVSEAPTEAEPPASDSAPTAKAQPPPEDILGYVTVPRPRVRPSDLVAQTTPRAADASTIIRPQPRPANMAEIARAVREREATAALQARISRQGPTKHRVAQHATMQQAINLQEINVIGIYGTSARRWALVRLSSGERAKVRVGEQLDGGTVVAIGESELRYARSGRNIVLKMPGT
ncbi:MAG: hypothetical protein GDA40_09235 [Rhodobacteraceae bacterium]|nr:hypothetical protein [Paracoccaceae bacterium]